MPRNLIHAPIAALLFAVSGLASFASDPATVLHQAADKIVASIHKVPNYICSETVVRRSYQLTKPRRPRACSLILDERRHLPPDFLQLFSLDRLRLDVIWTEQGETYAWAGASRFEDKGFETIAAGGPMASGMFAGILTATFQSDVRQFRFTGSEDFDGRNVMQYQFKVPDRNSHFRVKTDSSWVVTAYQGKVLIDPATADVVHIEIETSVLPLQTHACQSSYELDFNEVKLGATPFVLPARARQWFIYPDGSETQTATDFGSCHEYLGESTIHFDLDSGPTPPENGAPPSGGAAAPAPVTAGLTFSMEMLDDIDTGNAAAGDRFRARLVQDLRDTRGRTLALAGSVVEGRLSLVEELIQSHEVRVAFAPLAIVSRDARILLSAVMARSQLRPPGSSGRPYRQVGAAFQFSGDAVVIPKGFRSDWRTTAAKRK